MGHDVQVVANHQLNTNSMQLLAADLAQRLQANIHYGYQDDLYIEGISNETFETVIIGKVENQFTETWILRDSYYLDNINATQNAGKRCYDLYNAKDYDGTEMYIFKHCFAPRINYDNRWWNFCKHFNGALNNWNEMNFHRTIVWQDVQRFGGDAAIY